MGYFVYLSKNKIQKFYTDMRRLFFDGRYGVVSCDPVGTSEAWQRI